MDRERSESCRKLICRYHSFPEGKRKDRLRNRIFEELQPFMTKWILSILSKKGLSLTREEVLSRSWDCFEFSLNHFKPHKKITVPNHFYNYSRYYIMMKPQIDKIIKPEAPDWELSALKVESFSKLYENLDELKTFRKLLDPEYILVFDDAIMSLIPYNNERQYRMRESTLPNARYKESKKIFKVVIDYLLRR